MHAPGDTEPRTLHARKEASPVLFGHAKLADDLQFAEYRHIARGSQLRACVVRTQLRLLAPKP